MEIFTFYPMSYPMSSPISCSMYYTMSYSMSHPMFYPIYYSMLKNPITFYMYYPIYAVFVHMEVIVQGLTSFKQDTQLLSPTMNHNHCLYAP